MKKVSKRVLLALLTLVLSVVTLGTTTYAWFTVGATVAVEEFEMNVQSGHGLEMTYVKKGGSEYGYVRNLSTDIILQYIATDYGYTDAAAFKAGFQLDAVTSVDGKAFKKIDDEHDLVDLLPSDNPFLEFKLKFRTKQANSKLVWNHVSIDSDGKLWAPEVNFTNISDGIVTKNDTPVKYYAKNGARVSIESGLITKVFELPEEPGKNAVLSNNEPIWDKGAHDYYNKVTNFDLSTKHSGYEAAETTTSVSAVDLMNFGDLIDDYHYADVTVRVYIEGFDSETFNAILSDNLKVALSFTLALTNP